MSWLTFTQYSQCKNPEGWQSPYLPQFQYPGQPPYNEGPTFTDTNVMDIFQQFFTPELSDELLDAMHT